MTKQPEPRMVFFKHEHHGKDMEGGESNKDRLPQGRGSRAATDGMFCAS